MHRSFRYELNDLGTNTKFKAAAIGAAQEGAEAMLQEKYSPDMSFEGYMIQ